MERLGLTEEQFRRFAAGAKSTWNAIAADIFEAGDDRISRDEVVEVTLDADRMRMFGEFGGRRKPTDWTKFYDEVLSPWLNKVYGTQEFRILMREVFPSTFYCR